VLREVGIAAIVVESVSRLFLRNSIARAIPIFQAPGVTAIAQDGETLEVDYPQGLVRNPATGASLPLRKFPELIEQIFECGGLPELAYERYIREAALGK
jgi:3-isopropylmalate dehydratase small subunit